MLWNGGICDLNVFVQFTYRFIRSYADIDLRPILVLQPGALPLHILLFGWVRVFFPYRARACTRHAEVPILASVCTRRKIVGMACMNSWYF
ncbi:hypothetical protein EJ02DRAFT_18537 [Clathrospora elynae]|uniref:Uncharacterized protein n=1 Tax=Clathrospora elynae TaxID=706981 RepID=A0A6A5SDD3_9PLEO|nr:hypothetical protein EJ02DRAFT_18537 [Clathrospora elynae]